MSQWLSVGRQESWIGGLGKGTVGGGAGGVECVGLRLKEVAVEGSHRCGPYIVYEDSWASEKHGWWRVGNPGRRMVPLHLKAV